VVQQRKVGLIAVPGVDDQNVRSMFAGALLTGIHAPRLAPDVASDAAPAGRSVTGLRTATTSPR
jgi:hypothetical protein